MSSEVHAASQLQGDDMLRGCSMHAFSRWAAWAAAAAAAAAAASWLPSSRATTARWRCTVASAARAASARAAWSTSY